MDLINNISQNIIQKLPETIEEATYDSYEESNPFSQTFNDIEIDNKNVKTAFDTTKNVSSEVYSALTNPFYLTHKFLQIPTYYKTAVENYNKIINSDKHDKP